MFYTYLWLREDGTPYYVGKGSGDRAFTSDQHRHKRPKNIDSILVQEFPSEEDAFASEIFLIAYYGRKDLGTGCLRNLSDGGENPPSWKGKRHSDVTKEKMRTLNLGKKHTPETKEKIGLLKLGNTNMLGHKHTDETKVMLRLASLGNTNWLGRKHSDETIEKLVLSHKGKPWSEVRRAAHVTVTGTSNPFFGKKHTPETKLKMVEAQRLRRSKNL